MQRGGGPGDDVNRAIEGFPGYFLGFGNTQPRTVTQNDMSPFFDEQTDGTKTPKENMANEFNKIKWNGNLGKFDGAAKGLLEQLIEKFQNDAMIVFDEQSGEVKLDNANSSSCSSSNEINTIKKIAEPEKTTKSKEIFIDTIKMCQDADLTKVLNALKIYKVTLNYVNLDETTGNSALHYAVMNPNSAVLEQIYNLLDATGTTKEKIDKINKKNNDGNGKTAIELLVEKVLELKFSIDKHLPILLKKSKFVEAKNKLNELLITKQEEQPEYEDGSQEFNNIANDISKINNALKVITDKEQELHTNYDDSIKNKHKVSAEDYAFEQIKKGAKGDRKFEILNKEVLWDSNTEQTKSPVEATFGSGKAYNVSFTQEDANAFKSKYESKLKELCDADFQTVLNEYPDVKSFSKTNAPSPIVERAAPPPTAPTPIAVGGRRSRKNRRKSKGKSNKK